MIMLFTDITYNTVNTARNYRFCKGDSNQN